jgi:hypothetical protein
MGAYVGAVTLVATATPRQLDGVEVTLAAADDRWFGTVQAGGTGLLDGETVVVRLPSGLEGTARVVIDLTGPEPLIRLRGVGRAPL